VTSPFLQASNNSLKGSHALVANKSMAVLIDEVDLLVAILMAFSLFPFFNSTSVTSFFLLGREIVEERYTQYKRPAVIACGLLFTH